MSIFQAALDFSRFDNMQKLEAAGAFDSKILRPGDVRDPESFKVRRGKVGGYREYLSAEDQEYAAGALTNLESGFGYSPGVSCTLPRAATYLVATLEHYHSLSSATL